MSSLPQNGQRIVFSSPQASRRRLWPGGLEIRIDRKPPAQLLHLGTNLLLYSAVVIRIRGKTVEKRNIEIDRIERIANSIQRQIETSGDTDIQSKQIGEMVMSALASLDQVAYVRFASVYRNFREASDFEEFVGKLGGEPD